MSVTEVERLREVVKDHGIERAFKTYYGNYRAFVLNNKDPETRGRVQISCPEVGHDPQKALPVWVSPATDVTGDRMGWFNPPLQGSVVRVAFDQGNPGKPKTYWGGWYTKSDGKIPPPTEFGYADDETPQKRGFRSRAGHLILFNDEPGKEQVRILWHQIADGDPAKSDPQKVAQSPAAGDLIGVLDFTKDGVQLIGPDGSKVALDRKNKQILIQDGTGNLFTMSAKGISLIDSTSGGATSVQLNNKGDFSVIASKNINLSAPNINLKGAGIFLSDGAVLSGVNWEPLLAWLSTHIHPTGTGPSGPPAVPPTPTIKSQSVKMK
jgi:hypothetical protein